MDCRAVPCEIPRFVTGNGKEVSSFCMRMARDGEEGLGYDGLAELGG
jgi:hypothetical protein